MAELELAIEPAAEPTAEAATDGQAKIELTAEQQAKLEQARRRPWDDERVLAQLNRIVDVRLALHEAFGQA